MDENEQETKARTENAATEPQEEKLTDEQALGMYKRKKRNGKFVSALSSQDLDALQRKKSLFMYLSTLLFAVSLFLKVEGRTKLSETKSLFAVFTLYVIAELVLIILTVFIAVMNRTGQKIGRELKESCVPRDGLDKHTFLSYEAFTLLHVLMAAAEIAVSVYSFGIWGAFNIAVSAGSAVCAVISRRILFKANAGNLEYFPPREDEEPESRRNNKKHKKQ